MNCIQLNQTTPPGDYYGTVTIGVGGVTSTCFHEDKSLSDHAAEWALPVLVLIVGLVFIYWVRRNQETELPSIPGMSGREDFGRDDE